MLCKLLAFQELPRIEKELEDLVLQWEVEKGKPFLLGEHSVSEYIQDQWEKYKNQKEQEKKDRVSFQLYSYTKSSMKVFLNQSSSDPKGTEESVRGFPSLFFFLFGNPSNPRFS